MFYVSGTPKSPENLSTFKRVQSLFHLVHQTSLLTSEYSICGRDVLASHRSRCGIITPASQTHIQTVQSFRRRIPRGCPACKGHTIYPPTKLPKNRRYVPRSHFRKECVSLIAEGYCTPARRIVNRLGFVFFCNLRTLEISVLSSGYGVFKAHSNGIHSDSLPSPLHIL